MRCFLFFLLSATFSFSAWGQSSVRVRLAQGLDELTIQGQGLQFSGSQKADVLQIALPREQSFQIRSQSHQGHFFWQIEDLSSHQLQVQSAPYLAVLGHSIRVNGKPCPDQLIFSAPSKNKLDLIGVLPLEEYVTGVVAKEMPLQWPLEALKAQAIATRSYTLAVLQERKQKIFQLESSVLDQVFASLTSSQNKNPKYVRVREAVSQTQGQTLRTNKDRVLKAFYHSECGGRTGSSKGIFKVAGLNGGVVDSSCPLHRDSKWSFQISAEALSRQLSVSEVTALELQREDSGHIVLVDVKAASGNARRVPSQKFRELLGFEKIKSNIFTVTRSGADWIFEGQGRGHGVGLCQWGSRKLAEQGKRAAEILRHYYPEARLMLDAGENLHGKEANRDDHQQLFE